jgi:hypothetical protein
MSSAIAVVVHLGNFLLTFVISLGSTLIHAAIKNRTKKSGTTSNKCGTNKRTHYSVD